MSVIRVNAGPDRIYSPSIPVSFPATISGFAGLTAPVSFIWDFGDGTFLSGLLAPDSLRTVPVTVDSSGNAAFTIEHTYGNNTPSPVTATLRITDAASGIGVDDALLRRCLDPAGDAVSTDADMVRCTVNNDATTITFALRVGGIVSGDFQYRIGLDIGTFTIDPLSGAKVFVSKEPDGVGDLKLRYDSGKVTGLPSLVVVPEGDQVRFTFNSADIARGSGDYIQFYVETQAGVPSAPEVGIADSMPNIGWFGYVLR